MSEGDKEKGEKDGENLRGEKKQCSKIFQEGGGIAKTTDQAEFGA